MPGIAGIISKHPHAERRQDLALMLDTMKHQPWYVSGVSVAPDLGVYAGWVAHPGSFAHRQSAGPSLDDVDVVVAGEYAAAEAPEETRDGGQMAALYRAHGDACCGRLNGLFSALIVDRIKRRALLFNDKYGVERLYVHDTNDATYFASEAKALLAVLPAARAFDSDAVAEFLAFGSPLGGRTLFRGISLLNGGSRWTFEGSLLRKQRYFTPEHWESQPTLSAQDFDHEFDARFSRALRRCINDETTLGVSLTGGLDTRLIMACLPALPAPPVCYTFAGPIGDTRDTSVARAVAAACGLAHQTLRIGPDFLRDFERHATRTIHVTDGACSVMGAHEIYLNAQARQLATTRLTGNFGSEVLRGMSTLKPLRLASEFIAADFQHHIRHATASVAVSGSPITFAAFREIPWNLFGTMAAAKSQITFRTPYLDDDLVSLAYQAPTAARSVADSMFAVVERHHQTLASIATDRAVAAHGAGVRYALRRAFAEATFKIDYVHKEALPSWLSRFDRALGGLSQVGLLGHKYLTYRSWFRRELADYVSDVAADCARRGQPFWNSAALPALVRAHIAGRSNHVREINAVVTLATIERVLLQTPSYRTSDHIDQVVAAVK